MAALDTAIASSKKDTRVKRGYDEGGGELLEKLFFLWSLCGRGFRRGLLCQSLGSKFINQHGSTQPMSFGAALGTAIFFPHTVGKISNALIAARNHIVHNRHVHHHRSKIKQMKLYATKWCSAQ